MAIDGRYMRLPSSLRGPFALISTRSGTRLVRDLAKCRRPQMSPRETCQPHIAVGWQVIERFAKPKGYRSKQISAQTILDIVNRASHDNFAIIKVTYAELDIPYETQPHTVKYITIPKLSSIVHSASFLQLYNTQQFCLRVFCPSNKQPYAGNQLLE